LGRAISKTIIADSGAPKLGLDPALSLYKPSWRVKPLTSHDGDQFSGVLNALPAPGDVLIGTHEYERGLVKVPRIRMVDVKDSYR
jgi:hypothetical protein